MKNKTFTKISSFFFKQQHRFNSAVYWENRYRTGGNSGAGSYGRLAEFKAEIINNFIKENNIRSVIEFGVGDGNQLSLLKCPNYIGIDVSDTILNNAKRMFDDDATKSFYLLSEYHKQQAELALSLDVVYHLIEDQVFYNYMMNLFNAATRCVIIYSSNFHREHCTHVKHRKFSEWIDKYATEWELLDHIPNKYQYDINNVNQTSFSDFYIYHCPG